MIIYEGDIDSKFPLSRHWQRKHEDIVIKGDSGNFGSRGKGTGHMGADWNRGTGTEGQKQGDIDRGTGTARHGNMGT